MTRTKFAAIVVVYLVMLAALQIGLFRLGHPVVVWFWCDLVKVCSR